MNSNCLGNRLNLSTLRCFTFMQLGKGTLGFFEEEETEEGDNQTGHTQADDRDEDRREQRGHQGRASDS